MFSQLVTGEMGFWEHLYNATPKFLTGKPTDNPSDLNNYAKQHRSPAPETQIVATTSAQTPYPYSLTALIKLTATVTTAGAKNLTSYLPEPDRRAKISGAVTDFGKQTVTHAWQIPYNLSLAAALKVNQAFQNESVQNLKHYLPEPDRREKITRIVTNIGKLAVDSAINESLKGFIGGVQVYKIVKEGLKDESSSLSSNDEKMKAELLKVKVMEAKMKQMEEEFNTIKAKLQQQQQHNTSHKTEDGSVQQDTT